MTERTSYLEILAAETDGKRTFWPRIGTAFPTKDGRGFRLKINLMPQGQNPEILMLPPREAPSKLGVEGQ